MTQMQFHFFWYVGRYFSIYSFVTFQFTNNFPDMACENWLRREPANTVTFSLDVFDARVMFIPFDNIVNPIKTEIETESLILPIVQNKVVKNDLK